MKLPAPLVRVRSAAAQGLALVLRVAEPILSRARRFGYEVLARSRLRGRVASGVQFVGPVIVEGTGNVHIGPRTRVGRHVFFETYGAAAIEIGSDATINDGVVLVAYAGIHIGDGAMIGEYAGVRDANHGVRLGVPVRLQEHASAPVQIGADAWIGRGSIVLRGVAIGAGAVVGANSVVTRDVAGNAIVAGAPARPIGERPDAADFGAATGLREEG
ncbi:MAG TPA: acyltransferase [Candidatus Hydrogenedentes bacterium]|nr:acyltransferase [Candidatus Hydrogenedentota bacterium]HNT89030.1 acyltransferase [Candidatus Hydrogenedentota bacterium]